MARTSGNKITMTETRSGSPNGHNVMFFEVGNTYTTSERLARIFVDNGWATWAVEEKMIPAAPENKMEASSGENKVLDSDAAGNEKASNEKEVKVSKRGR